MSDLNINSEEEVKKLVEKRIGNPNIRHQYLSILADAIVKANNLDRRQWVVTIQKDIPRLVVGHYYTYSLFDISKGVWIALDTARLETLLRSGAADAFKKTWKPDSLDEYPHYQDKHRPGREFSTNGYYDLSVDPYFWPIVEQLSFGFIAKALDKDIGQVMRVDSRRNHAPGILKYMRTALGRQIPDPKY